MEIQDFMDRAIAEQLDNDSNMLEQAIIGFFGSVDRAKELIKYYVVEEDTQYGNMETNLYEPYITLVFQTTYKIRPKTVEELARDRAEEILESHTQMVCIVCREPILAGNLENTIHGAYHTWCLEGHP